MTKRLFETAQILIYDPVASNRNATRASLHSIGFRHVEQAAALDILENRLKIRSPDLLLCEVAGAETEVCRLIQFIRQGIVGQNPFSVVVVSTWRRDGTIVGQVLNSGADDLIARPFSTAILGDRIKALAERRKPFAITSDYIGPDRRRDPARPGTECVTVPNPLQLRSLDGIGEEESERQIADAIAVGKEMLSREKMRRDAIQIGVQWRMLEQRGAGTRDLFDIMVRMERMAEGIRRRAAGTEFESACEWCESLISSIGTISGLAGRSDSGRPLISGDLSAPLKLVGHAAMALGQIFAPESVAQPLLVDIEGPSTALARAAVA